MNPSYLVVLLVGVTAIVAQKELECKPEIIDKIKALWNSNGIPKDILGFQGVYKSYKSTSTPEDIKVKCTTLTMVNGKIQVNSDGTIRNIEATAADGVITSGGMKNYIVVSSDGVHGGYKCTPGGTAITATSVLDAGFSYGANALKSALANAEKTFKELGFNLDKSYSC